jgi:hypothetical protein
MMPSEQTAALAGIDRFFVQPLPCDGCAGLGFVDAGTAVASCAQCDGDGAKRIGDEPVTPALAARLRHFAERGE